MKIRERAVCISVGAASVREIDRLNIYHATVMAMRRALTRLGQRPHHVLIDGKPIRSLGIEHTAIVGGDDACYSIACASIVAKVTRDRLMHALAVRYPGYRWERNVGYATAAHLEGLGARRPHAASSALVHSGASALARFWRGRSRLRRFAGDRNRLRRSLAHRREPVGPNRAALASPSSAALRTRAVSDAASMCTRDSTGWPVAVGRSPMRVPDPSARAVADELARSGPERPITGAKRTSLLARIPRRTYNRVARSLPTHHGPRVVPRARDG